METSWVSERLFWFIAFWVVGLAALAIWHIFSYARVFVGAIKPAIPFTAAGAVIAIIATGLVVWVFDFSDPFLILLSIFIGVFFIARGISSSLFNDKYFNAKTEIAAIKMIMARSEEDWEQANEWKKPVSQNNFERTKAVRPS